VNADLLIRTPTHPAPGETVLGRSFSVLAGGKGANQAVAAARLGARVCLVGAVGADELARPALATLRESDVDLTAVAVLSEPTGVAMITVADGGENAIVVAPGANALIDARHLDSHLPLIGGAEVVVLPGEIPRSGIEAAIRAARGRVVLNLAPVIEVDLDVLRRVDPLVVNEYEAFDTLEMVAGAAARREVGNDCYAAARALLAAGIPAVVITLGARGALVAQGDEVAAIRSPAVTAVDTTGAGDAFVGALASRLAAGDNLINATRLAVRVGAFSVTGYGAQNSYPTLNDPLPA